MSVPWSILVIVLGGLIAAALYVALEGGEHLRGADRLVDDMIRERDQ